MYTKIQKEKKRKMEECFICFEEKEEDDFVFFPCTHKTCGACFVQMIQQYQKCPLCNSPIYTQKKELRIQIQQQQELEIYQRQHVHQPNQVSDCDINRCCYSTCFLIVVMLVVYIILQQ